MRGALKEHLQELRALCQQQHLRAWLNRVLRGDKELADNARCQELTQSLLSTFLDHLVDELERVQRRRGAAHVLALNQADESCGTNLFVESSSKPVQLFTQISSALYKHFWLHGTDDVACETLSLLLR